MRTGLVGIVLWLALGPSAQAASCPATLDFSFRTLAGEERVRLCERYAGKVVLVVNTASKCAYTDQYSGLETLYETYKDQGLVVLGFPSNDFAGQEPGSEKQIKAFCRLTYGVQFPMFEKIHVDRARAHPFYQKLATLAGGYPRWNFHKYLLGRDGGLVASFDTALEPGHPTVLRAIRQELDRQGGGK